jgi:hypothetical protein
MSRALCTPLAILLLAGLGCGEKKPQAGGKMDDAAPAKAPPPAPVEANPQPMQKFRADGDEKVALAALGSLPAWSAVIERHRFLARRDQAGVVHGLLIEHEGQLRLVDESEGQGSLSIPVRLPELVDFEPPQRVVLWGAWHDQEKSFQWQATRGELLEPAATAPEFGPGLKARDKEAPEELQLASSVSRKGGAISFTVHQRQDRIGDGWLISDRPGIPPIARLLLPGEREPYGDQSRVTEEERWQLRGNHHYWLEIGRFRPRSDGELPVYKARTPPFRFTPPAPESAPDPVP